MSSVPGREPQYLRPSGLAFRRLDDETVIVDARSRRVHVLNGTGSRIWDLLEGRRSVADLVSALAADGALSAPPLQVHRDVAEFLNELGRLGLVLVAGAGGEDDDG